jgi:hypothetical protein
MYNRLLNRQHGRAQLFRAGRQIGDEAALAPSIDAVALGAMVLRLS